MGIEEGVPYIVSELVEGASLRERLRDGALPTREVIAIGSQVAEALAAAHQRSIVHRDIKPENILVAADGVVKVIDFGIAKVGDIGAADTLAMTAGSTAAGVVIGTASYMSPEQIRGEPVDHRSDLFSFGAVLFEMACGSRPFGGETTAEMMAAVLRDEPRSLATLSTLPPALTAIIGRCLDKRPTHRFQSASDLAFALQAVPRSSVVGAVPIIEPVHRRLRKPLAIAGTLGMLLVAAGAIDAWRHQALETTGNAVVRQLTFDSGVEAFPNLSRDGSLVIYAGNVSGNRDIFLRDVGAREAINLTADSAGNDSQPALSADDQQIAFRSDREGGGIFVLGRTGGIARRISRSGFNPSWSPDGKQIATGSESVEWRPDNRSANRSQIQITDIVTGSVRVLETDDAVQPAWSPDGKRIAYWGLWERNQRDLWTVPVDGGAPVRITSDEALDWDPSWSPDGRWLYFSSDRGGAMNLWRIPIDETTGAATAQPEPLKLPASWVGYGRVGHGGQIIFASFQRTGNLERVPLDLERGAFAGPPEMLTTGSNYFVAPQPSRDGRWLAFIGQNGTARSVFVSSFDGRSIRPVMDADGRAAGVNWGPSDRMMFYWSRAGRYQVFTVNKDGGELRQETDLPGHGVGRAIWSRSGRYATVQETVTLTTGIIELSQSQRLTTFAALPPMPDGSTFSPSTWSPDDSQIAGESSSGGVVVYSVSNRTYRQITKRSTGGPRWMSENRIMYSTDGEFFIIDLRTGVEKRLGPPSAPAANIDSRPVVSWSASWDGRWLYRSLGLSQSDLWISSQ